jgi:uncharacterized membrane protein
MPVRPPAASPQSIQLTQQTFQGPVPPPVILEGYERIHPGATNRIFTMAESEQAHRHALEVAATNANIAAQEKQIAIAEQKAKSETLSDRIGQFTGFSAVLISMGCAVYFGSHGEPWLAGLFIGIPLVGLVDVLRNKPRPQEPKK